MSFTKKWAVAICAMFVLFSVTRESFADTEKYILEKEAVYRVKDDGTRLKIEDVNIMAVGINAGADGGIFWFGVDPNTNEAMEGSASGIYFFDDKEKPLFYMPYEDAGMVGGIFFNNDCTQMVLDMGTWVVRDLILYDFKGTEAKSSFTGMGDPVWIDNHRFAFSMVDSEAEPRPAATDYTGWTSVVVYDSAVKETVQVMKATEVKDYTLNGVDWDKNELRITETSVASKADWADPEKQQDKEITVPFPAAG